MDAPLVFGYLAQQAWFAVLRDLCRALERKDKDCTATHYRELFRNLAEAGFANLSVAVADTLVFGPSALADRAAAVPAGLRTGALRDVEVLVALAQRDLAGEAGELLDQRLPRLECLAPEPGDATVRVVAEAFSSGDAQALLDMLLTRYREHGTGDLARYLALRWSFADRRLEGIARPSRPDGSRLVDLERPLTLLRRNTEAFLDGRPAQHTLLYGPRGSGKSTAVKSLLTQYADRGLRMVELAPAGLPDLAEVTEQLGPGPQRFILFVDDLSYEADSAHYGPLKTLLEGSLSERPTNVLIYATSNRRHLVRERFSERPDPLDEDVHAWDGQQEKLALADRFGLTITFPDGSQARYLQIVCALAERAGLTLPDLDQRAVRFADWGNGYSGRTAQQFIESLQARLA